ncbi:50S ribosomal protein L24 domain protein [Trichuris suis]|nr:50S ribosomal protein L24 domain protein [Trichuris suis]
MSYRRGWEVLVGLLPQLCRDVTPCGDKFLVQKYAQEAIVSNGWNKGRLGEAHVSVSRITAVSKKSRRADRLLRARERRLLKVGFFSSTTGLAHFENKLPLWK